MTDAIVTDPNDDRQAIATGGCQCGAVRYATYAELTGTSVCHCRMCQKAVGGPFAVYGGVQTRDFAWTRGTPAAYQSSSLAMRDFCRDCGTPLTYRILDSTRITLSAGSLDDPAKAVPEHQIGMEARMGWLDGLNDLPGQTTEQDSGADFVACCISYQHPDRETGDAWTPSKE